MSTQMPTAESATDLPEVLPLIAGLAMHPREKSDHVILEDTDRRKFFRLGTAEAVFVRNLLESSSPQEALLLTSRIDSTFTAETALGLCKWLVVNELTGTERADNPLQRPKSSANVVSLAYFCKIPLLNPDRWLKSLVNYFGWLFSPQAMVIGLAIFAIGLIQTTGNWTEFVQSYENLFTSWRGLSLAIIWFALKIIHEVAHGATCRRYGGEVNEAGFALILLMPIAYVNVTSSWRFVSRWQRLHVTLAGVAAELFVAGVALILWNVIGASALKQAAADIVLLASVSSILFNLNPLLKFDGYFALADISGVDNLYSYGQRYAQYFGARYVLGLDATPPSNCGSKHGWIKVYGVAAAVYRVFTIAGLLTGAAALFSGAGIIIAAGGIGAFVLVPTFKFVVRLQQLRAEGNLSLFRLSLRLGMLASVSFGVLGLIPVSWTFTSPAIVQYDPPATLRPRTAGFIDSIYVSDGAQVHKGQPIVTLRNDELVLQLSELRKSLAQTEQQILAAQWHSESSELGKANLAKAGLIEQVTELESEIDALTVRAPVAGTLVARNLHLLAGTYVESGYELAVIGREDSKRLKVSITQTDAKQSAVWLNRPLRIVVQGCPAMYGRIDRLDSRADSRPPHEALLAVNGGPLATVQLSAGEFELDEPRINGYIKLPPVQSSLLRCGQKANVRLGTQGQTLGSLLFQKISNHSFGLPLSSLR